MLSAAKMNKQIDIIALITAVMDFNSQTIDKNYSP